jgi:hypothetical protein
VGAIVVAKKKRRYPAAIAVAKKNAVILLPSPQAMDSGISGVQRESESHSL